MQVPFRRVQSSRAVSHDCGKSEYPERKGRHTMVSFAIVELDDGLTIATIQPGQSPEDAAMASHGILVDPGPYATYEEACDALSELESDVEDERV